MKKFNGQSESTATAYTAKAPPTTTTSAKLIILETIHQQELKLLQSNPHHRKVAEKNQIGVVGASGVTALTAQSSETLVTLTAAEVVVAAVNAISVKIFNLQESLTTVKRAEMFI